MIDFNQLSLQTIGILSAIAVPVLSAILLYFGKIISDTKVERYDRTSLYFEGLFFSAIYLYVPTILAILFLSKFSDYLSEIFYFGFSIIFLSVLYFLLFYFMKNVKENITKRIKAVFFSFLLGVFVLSICYFLIYQKISLSVRILTIQFILLSFLSYNLKANNYLRRFGGKSEFEKRLKQKFLELESGKGILSTWFKKYKFYDPIKLNLIVWYYMPIKLFGDPKMLMLTSFLTIISSIYFFISKQLFLLGISILFSFFILTLVALAYGFGNAYYPPSKIYLNDKPIEGKIIKFEPDFIFVIKDNKKIFMNKNKVDRIEQNLYKEKNENAIKTKNQSE